VTEAAVQAFLDAGFSRGNVLDVVMGVTMKTLSNYANHVMQTPVDDVFAGERWEAAQP
jgi:alkylhydroperoxidase family enzyme